jgi:hypothetical protein
MSGRFWLRTKYRFDVPPLRSTYRLRLILRRTPHLGGGGFPQAKIQMPRGWRAGKDILEGSDGGEIKGRIAPSFVSRTCNDSDYSTIDSRP